MNKRLLFVVMLLFSVSLFAQQKINDTTTKSYQSEWDKVIQMEKDNLPKSAKEITDKILLQAIADKNTSQAIKALFMKNKYEIVIDSDNNTSIFSDLEKLLAQSDKPADKALLHHILGDLYLKYYDNNSWIINNRSQLNNYVPNDIKEWSKNIFYDKIIEHLNLSVKDKDALLSVTTKEYKDIISINRYSSEYYPTLYDFIMYRNIVLSTSLKIDDLNNIVSKSGFTWNEIYGLADSFTKLNLGNNDKDYGLYSLKLFQQYMSSLLERDMPQTLVFIELRKSSHLKKSSIYTNNYLINTLLSIYDKYKNDSTSVETIDLIAQYYVNSNGEEKDSNRTQAYEWLLKGLEKYPQYKRINILKKTLQALKNPEARISSSESIFYLGDEMKKIKLQYKNINKVSFDISRKTGDDKYVPYKKYDVELNAETSHLFYTKELNLDISEGGTYKIDLSFDKALNDQRPFEVTISNIASYARMASEKDYEFYIINRRNGAPIKNAVIDILEDGKLIKKLHTNNQGFATYTSDIELKSDYSLRSKFQYEIYTKEGRTYSKNRLPYSYIFQRREKPERIDTEKINIFTDRSIYRPGQTVYYKAVAVNSKDDKLNPIRNNKYTIKLSDINNQVISEQTLSTNEFGSISGQFTLPVGRTTGMYQLQINDIREYIQVEEYKRPTFQVTFDKIDKTYSFGDKVILKGQVESFSGVKIQDANVEYFISKRNYWGWNRSSDFSESGNVTSKSDGSFEITFTIPENDFDEPLFWRNIYSFNVSATVTDLNGETQNGEYSFSVGSVSMILSTNIPDKIDKNSTDNFEIKAQNLNGQDISASGTYVIYKDTITNEILKGEFTTGIQTLLKSHIQKLSSGKYTIKLKSKDDNGKEVENESSFILYSDNDKKPPIETNDWLIQKNTRFSINKPAEIVIGISAENITILYELIKDEKVFQRQQIKLSNENKTLVIPYKAEYEDGINAILTYMVNGESYQKYIYLTKEKIDNKQLQLKLEVFRDKLRPGQKEEWRISVKDNQSKPVFAELLASMYDTSLDKIYQSRNWSFDGLYNYSYSSPITFELNERNYGVYNQYYFYYKEIKSPAFFFDRIKDFGFSFNDIGMYLTGAIAGVNIKNTASDNIRIRGASSLKSEALQSDGIVLQENAVVGYGAEMEINKVKESVPSAAKEDNTTPQIRQNFNETAFFFPQLKTDQNGETIISFTVPESNTTWKFRAIAYDKSLNIGSLEAITMTRKDMMVIPNLPRFMRQGDKTTISTKISNLSEDAITGKVRIEFFDPTNDMLIDLNINNQFQTFNIEKNASTSAEWTFQVPANIDMIACRIIAENELFSDGEQHIIPVLPNRMLVTESMPLNVNGIGSKQFVLDKLANNKSASLSNYRLTLEYSSNPSWYAVQALPEFNNPTNENVVNWFASYYVNTLGYSINKQYPKVAAMINTWKKQGENKESLTSKLMQNEELKSVLLEETPWVLDAKSETEQMQRLSLLLDLNNTQYQQSSATNKLIELQNSDGGWSWYKGFKSNRSITQYILYGYSQLARLNAVEFPTEIREMQMNALKFIDKEIREDFESLKKNNKNWEKISSISTYQIEYLFVRSRYRDIPIDQETRSAERFYTTIAENSWNKLGLYEKSLLAMLANQNENKELANKIINSLREYATIDSEKGMFWANNRSNVFMSLSSVSKHTFIMEAFNDMKVDKKEMNLMKLWLLKQKQTQVWESTHATLDAIFALLSTGSDWFSDSGDVAIKVGGKEVNQSDILKGSGYIKEAWSKTEMSAQMAKVEVENKKDIPSYGALYWQYYEDLNKISSQSNVLNVTKGIFIEKVSESGKSLQVVSDNNMLKVGDKVVIRLTVHVDRDMEFVHLKDMRASCFEPVSTISGLSWNERVMYYQSTKDASTNYYFDHLPKGTYVFEYPVYVSRKGEYSNGISTIQCLYAPEFISHTAGVTIKVQ